jgi:hypothetical protein
MTGFIAMVGDFITALVGWIPDITAMIIADPLMVLPFVIMVVGLAFGLLGRIFSLR